MSDSVWVPTDFRNWPDPADGDWRQTLAASQQYHDEWRIRYAQDAEDEAAEQ